MIGNGITIFIIILRRSKTLYLPFQSHIFRFFQLQLCLQRLHKLIPLVHYRIDVRLQLLPIRSDHLELLANLLNPSLSPYLVQG
jgi:hypothetical protein